MSVGLRYLPGLPGKEPAPARGEILVDGAGGWRSALERLLGVAAGLEGGVVEAGLRLLGHESDLGLVGTGTILPTARP